MAARLARRLRLPLVLPGSAEPDRRAQGGPDPLLEAGRQLRQAREARGIGLRQLAQDTRISTAVLEALERGWRDRLPEPTYLRSMLPLLERHLAMPTGSLNTALPRGSSRYSTGHRRESGLRRFTPGSIDVFTSWQGTLLYALLIIGLIHLLNLQQFRLASQGLLSSRPLPPLGNPAAATAGGADAALLAAFPDLRPISQAAAGQGLRLLRQQSSKGGPDLSLGILGLTTTAPTQVEIRSSRGESTSLKGVEGELNLPVLPPFRLELKPEPARGTVRWKGTVLTPLPNQPGTFLVPAPASAASTPNNQSNIDLQTKDPKINDSQNQYLQNQAAQNRDGKGQDGMAPPP